MAASTVAMSQHACVALNGGLCGSNVLSTRTESGVSFARTPLVKTGLAVERSAKRLVPISAHVDGLGATLPSGFEMTDYTVVDESFSGSLGGGIMEKIANGFKSFKENNFRYLTAIGTSECGVIDWTCSWDGRNVVLMFNDITAEICLFTIER